MIRKRSLVWGVLSVAGLSVGTVMAWPVVFPLYGPGGGVPASLSGANCISQPYVNPLADAEDLLLDINLTAGAAVTSAICRFHTLNNGISCYTGTAGVPFPLVAPEGYFALLNPVAPLAGVPYIIAGGLVPGFAVMLDGPGLTSLTGLHYLSIPDVDIPVPLADADALLALVGPAAKVACKCIRPTGILCYTGTAGVPFPLVPGEAYFVQVDAPGAAFLMP